MPSSLLKTHQSAAAAVAGVKPYWCRGQRALSMFFHRGAHPELSRSGKQATRTNYFVCYPRLFPLAATTVQLLAPIQHGGPTAELQFPGVNVMKKLATAVLLATAPLVVLAGTPLLYSPSVLVYDIRDQKVVLERDPDTARPVASLTKLMTAMVVLDEAQPMQEAVVIGDADIDRLKHSHSRIPVGATLGREEMLRLALMASENRAASALSRAFPGGQRAFVQKMNDKARALGMAATWFAEPTGLSAANVSTARDVVKMADAASRYPLIAAFTLLPHYEEAIGGRTMFYRNTDPVVDWPGWRAQLAKTGYTREAGRCIIVEAGLPNGPVIIALLGARSSSERSADLVTIRRWLNGDETSVVLPRIYHASALHRYHQAFSRSHRARMQLTAYQARKGSGAYPGNAKHHARKRHLRPTSNV
ncbi:serine hydrolase [Caballeronia arvi]|nr:serine hydrolase [Caballeronia arvi]